MRSRRRQRLVGTDLGKKVSKKKETGEAAALGSSARPQHKFTERRAAVAAPALPAAFYGKSMKTLRDVNSAFDTRPELHVTR